MRTAGTEPASWPRFLFGCADGVWPATIPTTTPTRTMSTTASTATDTRRGSDLSPNGLEPPPDSARSRASLALTAGAVPSSLSGAWNASAGAWGSRGWLGQARPPDLAANLGVVELRYVRRVRRPSAGAPAVTPTPLSTLARPADPRKGVVRRSRRCDVISSDFGREKGGVPVGDTEGAMVSSTFCCTATERSTNARDMAGTPSASATMPNRRSRWSCGSGGELPLEQAPAPDQLQG